MFTVFLPNIKFKYISTYGWKDRIFLNLQVLLLKKTVEIFKEIFFFFLQCCNYTYVIYTLSEHSLTNHNYYLSAILLNKNPRLVSLFMFNKFVDVLLCFVNMMKRYEFSLRFHLRRIHEFQTYPLVVKLDIN